MPIAQSPRFHGRLRALMPAVMLCLCGLLSGAEAQVSPQPAPALTGKAWRAPALNRPRRIIFNNDGNDPITKIRRPSVEDMLAARTAPLAGTHVDTISYCTFSAGFGNFSHFTKVGQLHLAKEDIFAHNQMPALVEAGIDPLRVMVDFAHAHRMECFWSMRMNDTHDGGKTGQGPVLFKNNKLKREHPEYLLGKPDQPLKHGSWSAVNYARAEIRELAFRYVEEVCQNYDVDGVELDFFRHPVFFPSTGRGEPATAAECAQMTDLMRRIRTMAENVGHARGRPILIAMRVPDSAEYARAIGLDLAQWLADDLLDLLVVSSYLQLNDWEYSVALARKHGVKIYPSLDESRLKDKAAVAPRMTDLAYRGRAANIWAAGADGVYLFNLFDPHRKLWRELGDPAALGRLDKDYFASIRGVGISAGGNLPHQSFQTVETLNPTAPRPLPPGKVVTARLHVGEKLNATDPVSLRLRLQFDRRIEATALTVALNGTPLAAGQANNDWLEFSLEAAAVRPGQNEVTVQLAASETRTLRWLDLMLAVRHPVSR
ncbi:MAG: hypothetical protein HZA31_07880 [Opitutae bacterium]|nr:hypothetical protein [Opitutae bacterium]